MVYKSRCQLFESFKHSKVYLTFLNSLLFAMWKTKVFVLTVIIMLGSSQGILLKKKHLLNPSDSENLIQDAKTAVHNFKNSISSTKEAVVHKISNAANTKLKVLRGIKEFKIGIIKNLVSKKVAKAVSLKTGKLAILRALLAHKLALFHQGKVLNREPAVGVSESSSTGQTSAGINSSKFSLLDFIIKKKKGFHKQKENSENTETTGYVLFPSPQHNPAVDIETYQSPAIIKHPNIKPSYIDVKPLPFIWGTIGSESSTAVPAAIYGPPTTSSIKPHAVYGVPN